MSTADAVLRIEGDAEVITAIERFSLDGSEPAAPVPGQPEDRSTRTREPSRAPNRVLDRRETAGAVTYLRDTLRVVPGFVAGLVLAGQDDELVVYSQWRRTSSPPGRIPDTWSVVPAVGRERLVDARTYTVDFTAPAATSTASAATPHAHFGVFTVEPDQQERLLELARLHAPDSMGTPGLEAINFHRSLDGRRVINLGLWTGFAEFTALLTHPGFTGGGEYWGDVAGFRPHYFDVAAVVTA